MKEAWFYRGHVYIRTEKIETLERFLVVSFRDLKFPSGGGCFEFGHALVERSEDGYGYKVVSADPNFADVNVSNIFGNSGGGASLFYYEPLDTNAPFEVSVFQEGRDEDGFPVYYKSVFRSVNGKIIPVVANMNLKTDEIAIELCLNGLERAVEYSTSRIINNKRNPDIHIYVLEDKDLA